MNDNMECEALQHQTTSDTSNSTVSEKLLTPPALSEKYRFIRKIGEGAQAKVFLAKRLSDNQNVAIKQLDIDSVSNWKEYDLFQREAKVLSSLDINGVAMFYEAVECLDDAHPCSYLVQEYIEGESLGNMLKAGHRFSIEQVYDIIIQMLTILYQLQNRPIPVIHRDIKPSNMMLTPVNDSYFVTLIDFGAVANPQVQSGGSTVAGTYGYMPPEQLMGRPQPASDIYSLAAVAVELFSGKSPATLPTKDFRLIFEPELESQPPALVNTLRKMLEPNAADRLCDCVWLIKTFKQFKEGAFNQEYAIRKLDDEFDEKLTEVTDFGAPGNIDLWQKLSDTVPRNLPLAYKNKDWAEFKRESNDIKAVTERYRMGRGILTALWVVVGICFLLICVVFRSVDWRMMVILAIFAGLFMALRQYAPTLLDKNDSRKLTDTEIPSEKIPDSVADLLIHGRKTIATIVSIEYMPVKDATISEDNAPAIVLERPVFRIKYKFNPPDDYRADDLIHKCYVFNEPEQFYRVGDPIPILYRIYGAYLGEVVHSMPFPYPLAFISEKNIISESHPGGEFLAYVNKFDPSLSYDFVKNSENPDLLGPCITDMIGCEFPLEMIQSFILPCLNCYLKSSKYRQAHAHCFDFMLWCAGNSDSVKLQVNSYIKNYLESMCVQNGSALPEIFKLLCNETNSDTCVLLDSTVQMLVDLLRSDCIKIDPPFVSDFFSYRLASAILKQKSNKRIHSTVLFGLCAWYDKHTAYVETWPLKCIRDYLMNLPVNTTVVTPDLISTICNNRLLSISYQRDQNDDKVTIMGKLLLNTLVDVYIKSKNEFLKNSIRNGFRSMSDVASARYYCDLLDQKTGVRQHG